MNPQISPDQCVLVLDNDPFRHEMFRAAVGKQQLCSTYEVGTLEAALQEDTRSPVIVCLDHDLGPIYNEEGKYPDTCGCDAANLVVKLVPKEVPVLIHSSNNRCAKIMRQILLDGNRTGRVSCVNTADVSSGSDKAGIQALRDAVAELLEDPCWPDDMSPLEVKELFGTVSPWGCSVQANRRGK